MLCVFASFVCISRTQKKKDEDEERSRHSFYYYYFFWFRDFCGNTYIARLTFLFSYKFLIRKPPTLSDS